MGKLIRHNTADFESWFNIIQTLCLDNGDFVFEPRLDIEEGMS